MLSRLWHLICLKAQLSQLLMHSDQPSYLPIITHMYIHVGTEEMSLLEILGKSKRSLKEKFATLFLSPPHEVMINGFGDVGRAEITCMFNSGRPLNRQSQESQQLWGWKDSWCHLKWPQGTQVLVQALLLDSTKVCGVSWSANALVLPWAMERFPTLWGGCLGWSES